MDDRIRDLAERAGLAWNTQPPHHTNTSNPVDFPVSANAQLEKFAQLIVQECCDVFVELRTRPADLAVLDVKQHFGLKL